MSKAEEHEMTHAMRAAEQFGPVADQYANFSYHASGPDLAPMLAAGRVVGDERVLDIGSGPGHTALLFAPHVHEVVALDPTEAMLDQGRRLAAERGISNLSFCLAGAEQVPYPDAHFDRVTSRQSAHHYPDVRAALDEVGRVLKQDGLFVLIDTFAPEEPALDAFLNEIELLRDPTHIRDYRVSDWREMFAEVGMELDELQHGSIRLEFENWVSRSRTTPKNVESLRRCFRDASDEARRFFEADADCNWTIPVGLVVGRRATRV